MAGTGNGSARQALGDSDSINPMYYTGQVQSLQGTVSLSGHGTRAAHTTDPAGNPERYPERHG